MPLDSNLPESLRNLDVITPSHINVEIGRLRREIDNVRSGEKSVQELRTAYNKQLEAIREEMQRKINAALEMKRQQDELLRALQDQVNGKIDQIGELEKLLARILEEQSKAERMAALHASLVELLEGFDSWKLAADFQKECVFEVYRAYKEGMNGFLIADDPGLGKTLEAILALRLIIAEFVKEYERQPRILWLTKKNLIRPTIKEYQKWDKDTMAIPLMGSETPAVRNQMFEIISIMGAIAVANYEVVNTMTLVRETDWDIVIVDECHKLKGGANIGKPTKIWTNTKDVCRRSRFMLMLSGTPMVNAPEEMWAYLHIFDPERFPSMKRFMGMFQVWDYMESKPKLDADKLLKGALKGQCVRRRKNEVGLQLPQETPSRHEIEWNDEQRKAYESMRDNFFVWLNNQPGEKLIPTAAIIAQLTRLRQINVWPVFNWKDPETGEITEFRVEDSGKVDEAMDMIEEFDQIERNLIIFCNFNEPLFELQRRCRERGITAEVIYGGEKNGDKIAYEFQQNRLRVLLCNLAMGEGMNLQRCADWPGGASDIVLLDKWWSPARNEQASARVMRMNSTLTENVTVHTFHTPNSVDDFIEMKNADKTAMFESILEKNELRPASEWRKLLEGLV